METEQLRDQQGDPRLPGVARAAQAETPPRKRHRWTPSFAHPPQPFVNLPELPQTRRESCVGEG